MVDCNFYFFYTYTFEKHFIHDKGCPEYYGYRESSKSCLFSRRGNRGEDVTALTLTCTFQLELKSSVHNGLSTTKESQKNWIS